MKWKKKLEIVYDAFDKGLGIRPIAHIRGFAIPNSVVEENQR